MTKTDKIQLAVFGVFFLGMITLVIYNALTLGTTCTFCVR
jgi:hypothetical protein